MNPKQEILNMLPQGAIEPEKRKRIRAILETHELVPVDTRPFDPTLCGFHSVDKSYKNSAIVRWECNPGALTVGWTIERENDLLCLAKWGVNQFWGIPWPATQSDGKKLLELLGALEK
jgi:hypothetical protein